MLIDDSTNFNRETCKDPQIGDIVVSRARSAMHLCSRVAGARNFSLFHELALTILQTIVKLTPTDPKVAMAPG